MGWWTDDMAATADAPFVARMDCGCAVVMPDVGSVFPDGHGPEVCDLLYGFFFRDVVACADHDVPSLLVCGVPGIEVLSDRGGDPLDKMVDVEESDADETSEASDADELDRWTPLRGRNMRATASSSSAFKLCATALAFHADDRAGSFGCATGAAAVIGAFSARKCRLEADTWPLAAPFQTGPDSGQEYRVDPSRWVMGRTT